MEELKRFGVSVPGNLLARFDEFTGRRGYTSRSEAIRDLIREKLVVQEWERPDSLVAGSVSLVYDHHQLDLPRRLAEFQHDHHDLIISTVHVHLDHYNCLEVLVLRGRAGEVRSFGETLVSLKGVRHGKLTLTTTGAGIA